MLHQAVKKAISGSDNFFIQHERDLYGRRDNWKFVADAWERYDEDKSGELVLDEIKVLCFDYFTALPEITRLQKHLPEDFLYRPMQAISLQTAKLILSEHAKEDRGIDWHEFKNVFFDLMGLIKRVSKTEVINALSPRGSFGKAVAKKSLAEEEEIDDETMKFIETYGDPEGGVISDRGSKVCIQKYFEKVISCCALGRLVRNYRQTKQRLFQRVLFQPPEERTHSELAEIAEAVKDVLTHYNVPVNMRETVCRAFDFFELSESELVFDQGDSPELFYIVLTGSVQYLKQRNRRVLLNKTSEPSQNSSSASTSESDPTAPEAFSAGIVSTLHEGSSFGEIELVTNEPRSLAASAREDTQLAVLSKDSFQKYLQPVDYDPSSFHKNTAFLSRCVLFNKTPTYYLKQLALFARKVNYPRDEVIVNQGDETTRGIFFVQSGSLAAIREVLTTNTGQSKGPMSSKCENKINPQFVEFPAIGPYSSFGECCINSGRHPVSIVSSMKVELLEISRFDILRRLDQPTLDLINCQVSSFPKDEKILKQLSLDTSWSDYKTKLTNLHKTRREPESLQTLTFNIPDYNWGCDFWLPDCQSLPGKFDELSIPTTTERGAKKEEQLHQNKRCQALFVSRSAAFQNAQAEESQNVRGLKSPRSERLLTHEVPFDDYNFLLPGVDKAVQQRWKALRKMWLKRMNV